ncbi:MAG TPA: pyridoxal-phosphate dependent enzyme, partial [Gillisia sp.]|nr:pyridoxal-phosphate dependent enzyme [Gillisia sp.]
MSTLSVIQKTYRPEIAAVKKAAERISKVAVKTPLTPSFTYSKKYDANILFKREDLQQVRSYKIRGAYNKISSLDKEQLERGVIYMPSTTPKQKVEQTRMFGGEWVDVVLKGDTYDDSFKSALKHCEKKGLVFIHPFDDEKVIEGQATIALEILEQAETPIDYVFAPLGGGGLLAGLSSVFKQLSPKTKIIGVEPEGAASMTSSLKEGKVVELKDIERFVDGAAVQKVGARNFEICKENLDEM